MSERSDQLERSSTRFFLISRGHYDEIDFVAILADDLETELYV